MRILGDFKGVYLNKRGRMIMAFELNSPNAVERAQELPKGICEVEVNKVRKDRTLNQNAMLWKLIGDISFMENGKRNADTEISIYRNILRKAGAKIETFSMKEDAVDEFLKRTGDIFRAYDIQHKWQASNGKWWVLIHTYYGTSTMTTEEMGKVIDEALAYASEIGLDVDYWRGEFYGNDPEGEGS